MKKTLTTDERTLLGTALTIAATSFASDAKNMGAQAGTLEAPLNRTYKALADVALAKEAVATALAATVTAATEIVIDDGTPDPDGL